MSEHTARPDSWSRPPLTALIGFAAAGFLGYWSAVFWVLWGRAFAYERGSGPRPADYGEGSTDQLVVAVPLTVLVIAFAAAGIYSARHTNRYTAGRTAVLGVTCFVIAGLVAALL